MILERVKIKGEIKEKEDKLKELDLQLMEDLENEPKRSYESDNYIAKIQQRRSKVFDLDKVLDLIGEDRVYKKVNKETGEITKLNLYNPSATVIKEYLQDKADKDELTHEQVEQYKASFYEKLSEPFIMVEDKSKKALKF